MAIKNINELKRQKEAIDLSGPNGNVFYLIGRAKRLAKELGLDPEAIADDMMSDDYDHAVETFDKHFGDFVDLYR